MFFNSLALFSTLVQCQFFPMFPPAIPPPARVPPSQVGQESIEIQVIPPLGGPTPTYPSIPGFTTTRVDQIIYQRPFMTPTAANGAIIPTPIQFPPGQMNPQFPYGPMNLPGQIIPFGQPAVNPIVNVNGQSPTRTNIRSTSTMNPSSAYSNAFGETLVGMVVMSLLALIG